MGKNMEGGMIFNGLFFIFQIQSHELYLILIDSKLENLNSFWKCEALNNGYGVSS